jgi:hypothetical protein
MGFFSFHTCDTGNSIANKFSGRPVFTVHMITPDGRVFTEEDYEGYGVFGGKDFYELLAELNGLDGDRQLGIDLVFRGNSTGDNTEGVIYPKLVERLAPDIKVQYHELPNPESCRDQGYFYYDDLDDEEEWYGEDEEEEEDL